MSMRLQHRYVFGAYLGYTYTSGGEGILDMSEYYSSTVKNILMHDTGLE